MMLFKTDRFKNMRLRTQLLLIVMIGIIVSVSVETIVLNYNSSRFMKSNAIESFTNINNQIAANIDETIDTIDNYYNFLISNRIVFNSLLKDDFGVSPESYEAVVYLKDLMSSLMINTDGLHSSYFITRNRNIIASVSGVIHPDFLKEENFFNHQAVKAIYDNPSESIWYTDDVEKSGYIFYLRGLQKPVSGDTLGILCFVIRAELFENQINKHVSEKYNIFISDAEGNPFVSSHENESLESTVFTELTEAGDSGLLEKNKDYYIGHSNSNGWMVITKLSQSDLYNYGQFLFVGLLTAILIMLTGGLFSLYISKKYTNDLTFIVEAMKTTSEGRLEEISVKGSNYETKNLAQSYNQMVRSIDDLTRTLRNEITEKNIVQHEVESLVRFTNENSSPIIRISSNGRLNYANKSAGAVIVENLFYNSMPDGKWFNDYLLNKDKCDEFEVTAKGKVFKVRPVSTAVEDEVFLHFRDLTVEREFAYLQNLWENMFENSNEGIVITDLDGKIEQVNRSFSKITGYSYEDVKGKTPGVLKSNRHTAEFYEELWDSLLAYGKWSGEIWNRKKSGEAYPEWLGISAFTEAKSGRRMYFAVFHDISDQKQQEERLEWMTNYDALTGLPNRTMFLEKVHSEFKAADRNNEICAILLMNIDGLKNINNNFGPNIGDAALQEFSRRLRLSMREEDVVSRFGGDEFIILAPRLKENERIFSILKRLQESLSETISIGPHLIDMSVSFGIALFPDDGQTPQDVIARAGSALIRTKQNRKGSYSMFAPELDDVLMANSEIELNLKKALNLGEFELFYQPKVDAVKNKIVGFEALLRWKRENNEYIPPFKFIPVAEDSGIIVEIGYFVIREACDFLLALRAQGESDIKIGINVSARQLAEPDFIENLLHIVKSKDIHPSNLDIEITESVTASEVYNAIESLSRLSESGFSISIDDFGTGYSSLKYLLTLPFDTIKIDKSFVDEIIGEDGQVTILNSMISLAHTLGKNLVAEGVETEEQLNYLINENCPVIQGYYFSKPLPQAQVLNYIKSEQFKK